MKAPMLNKRRHSRSNIEVEGLARPPSVTDFNKLVKDTDLKEQYQLLWSLMSTYLPSDKKSIQRSIVNHVEYSLAASRYNFNNRIAYLATANSVRDRLIETWNDTVQWIKDTKAKRISYMSLEFLMGRTFQNALVNFDLEESYSIAVEELGFQLTNLYVEEPDAALGNGGLGRLAACFLDSMATLNLPAWGYGIRYTYGIFEQLIQDGRQVEQPDYWLTHGNPWEIVRKDVVYPVRFYGHVVKHEDHHKTWEGGEIVDAIACDTPIPGYDTNHCINLRLWKAAPSREFDLSHFNEGRYAAAIEARQRAETITSVLYPNDSTNEGKELRLKQQYFFVSATLQDLLKEFKLRDEPISAFGKANAIQLNDTHPSIAIPELFRILVDEERLSFDDAWKIVEETFAYTNHTVLPEALEKWSVGLMEHLLPRHLEIIYQINWAFLCMVEKKFPGDVDRLARVSIIEEGSSKFIRMANLSIVCSHHVNGVAALHSEIIRTQLFKDFAQLYPGKFINITNGVTPRRWLYVANKPFTDLLSKHLGSNAWLKDLSQLSSLRMLRDDLAFQSEWQHAKLLAKKRLAAYVKDMMGIIIPVNALYDVQVKRIHEYKRQLMNCLYCIYRYHCIKQMTPSERQKVVPRVTFFSGKAAAGYAMAKNIIKLINDVSNVVNNDSDIGDLFKIVFIPNYKVSSAEIIIPASDLSQHISTAGMEASGTSNMKFIMNGGLIIGTMDGANVEIAEECGIENMFIFGTKSEDVPNIRHKQMYRDGDAHQGCAELRQVFDMLQQHMFSTNDVVEPILNSLRPCNDYYLVAEDFPSYLKAQEDVDTCYSNPTLWTSRSIAMTAGSGTFSTDRTIKQYAEKVWNVKGHLRPELVHSGSYDEMREQMRKSASNSSLNCEN